MTLSDDDHRNQEVAQVKKTTGKRLHLEDHKREKKQTQDTTTTVTAITTLPYMKGVTDSVSHITLQREDDLQTPQKTGTILRTPKDRTRLENQNAYQIPC